MKEYISKNRGKLFNYIVLFLYILITGLVLIKHEVYENEAQSFLLARDLSFPEIIMQMKYEGHSFLWYFIIAPIAKLGLPMKSQCIVSWLFGVATVLLILKKSKMNNILKLSFIFSSGLMYFYSIISRPYCMIPFFLALIASIYEKRDEHPYMFGILIALLANTHIIMIPTAFMLILFYWGKKIIKKDINIRKRDFWLSLLIAIGGILIFSIIVILTLFNMKLVEQNSKLGNINDINSFFQQFKDAYNLYAGFLYGKDNSPIYMKILLGISLLFCLIGIKNDKEQGIIFWAHLLFFYITHVFFWFFTGERVFIIVYTLMFWIWNTSSKEKNRKFFDRKSNVFFPALATTILVTISVVAEVKLLYGDIVTNYSRGKEVAKYIDSNIEKGSTIFCEFATQQQSIIGYLPKDKYKFYFMTTGKYQTFVTWSENWNKLLDDEKLDSILYEALQNNDYIYVLSEEFFNYRCNGSLNHKYDCDKILEAKNIPLVDTRYNYDEHFNLYKVVMSKSSEVSD